MKEVRLAVFGCSAGNRNRGSKEEEGTTRVGCGVEGIGREKAEAWHAFGVGLLGFV